MNPDELLTGALPFVNYSGPSSAVISTGVAPPQINGVSPAAAASGTIAAGGARVTATASGTTILLTWLAIVAILVAANVLTLRIQG